MSRSPATITEAPPDQAGANRRLLEELYGAFAAGDLEGVTACLHPDVAFHVPGTGVNAGDHVGIDAVLAFFGRAAALTDGTLRLDLRQVVAGDDVAVALATYRAERPGRRPLENRLAQVIEVSDGKIRECWFHSYDQYAVDEFWGS
jgi:ketosteroid isomerase-like protein